MAASGAVPGLWPHVHIKGNDWIDGGMISSTNTHLAQGYNKIIVIAPLDYKQGMVPSVYDEVAMLQQHSQVLLITLDNDSRQMIGSNIYDNSNLRAIGDAGYVQGTYIVKNEQQLIKYWRKYN
ncbi:putative esterase of the alpha-beta hydrolase superfamily [Staphylococcus simiae]|nr:putative esterase of the alpha-beta hydrolase superfamily [Staphylococcus simiae]